jgi:hypothetical protein
VFLCRLERDSSLERENPLAVIEAFRRAFRAGEDVQLQIICSDYDREALLELRAAADRPEIDVLHGDLTSDELGSYMAACDCYVSLHRSTAFGYRLAEAMWLGKPVVGTGHSGNLDFMTSDNSLLVDFRLVPIGASREPFPANALWAEPDVGHASRLMRRLFDDPAFGSGLGAKAGAHMRSGHSPARFSEIVYRRLESIRATGGARREGHNDITNAPAFSRLPLRIRQGPVPATHVVGKRGWRARSRVRRAALRLMRPFTAYQQEVNLGVVAALEELHAQNAHLRADVATEQASLMAQARANDRLGVELERQTRVSDDVRRALNQRTDRSLYVAVSELRQRHDQITAEPGEPGVSKALSAFEMRAFSQNGEDGVLAEILRRVGTPKRFFVELSVESAREGNCIYLADVVGWDGLFVESDDGFYRDVTSKYAAGDRVRTHHAAVSPENVVDLLAQAQVPGEPGVLSIHVDGQDYWIWEAIEGYQPRVVVIEYNSALDPRRRLVEPKGREHWGGTELFRASFGALEQLGERKGYRAVHTDMSGSSIFFVREDLAVDSLPAGRAVLVRRMPNYLETGYRRPAVTAGSRYLDLDTGQLVDVSDL